MNIHEYIHLQKKYKTKGWFFDLIYWGNEKMNEIEDIKNHSKKNKDKSFSLLTCNKDEFKDWFDPL